MPFVPERRGDIYGTHKQIRPRSLPTRCSEHTDASSDTLAARFPFVCLRDSVSWSTFSAPMRRNLANDRLRIATAELSLLQTHVQFLLGNKFSSCCHHLSNVCKPRGTRDRFETGGTVRSRCAASPCSKYQPPLPYYDNGRVGLALHLWLPAPFHA
jgi:hypothetical protein